MKYDRAAQRRKSLRACFKVLFCGPKVDEKGPAGEVVVAIEYLKKLRDDASHGGGHGEEVEGSDDSAVCVL